MTSSADIVEVQNTLSRYMRALDANDYPQMLELLTDDAELRMGGAANGRAEIVEMLANRSTDRCTRHVISNFYVSTTPDGYRAEFYLTGLSHPNEDGESKPYAMTGSRAIADMTADFRREGDALRINRLIADAIFVGH